MPEFKWVRANNDEGRVGLYEQHPDHPDGEVFVAGEPVKVALTAAVQRKLRDGELVESSESDTKPFSDNLRKPTEKEMEEANLKTPTEKATAVVEEEEDDDEDETSSPFLVGGRPVSAPRGRPKKG